MILKERIEAMAFLGNYLHKKGEYLQAVMHRTQFNNQWFTVENISSATDALSQAFLQKEKLENWAKNYAISDLKAPKKIGLILAGNIPLVGLHDLLSTFISGHRALIKLSDKDKFLLPHLLEIVQKEYPKFGDYFEIVDRLKGFDAVIATGSNNSARYFETYFGKYPHIIRKNRSSVAVLDGSETKAELLALGHDIFQYFGLGCRNISKIYVPKDYHFDLLLETLHAYNKIILNTKYKNNFDYNYALFLLNKVDFKANGCIILREDKAISSRIATLHFEYYDKKDNLRKKLDENSEKIQCIAAKNNEITKNTVPFGKTQQPELRDYADGVDTMRFLLDL